MDKLTLTDAARVLGISEGAVRKRYKRGKLRGETGVDGRLYVWVDRVDKEETDHPEPSGELVEELRDRVRSLEHQLEEANTANREHRRLLAAALERIPELEAPDASLAPQNNPNPGQRGAPEASTAETGEGHAELRRGLWNRIFGR